MNTAWRRMMAANYYASPDTTERLFTEAEAAGLLPEHIETGRGYLRESERLFAGGNVEAAGWAARCAWERANFLHAGAAEKTSIRAGRKQVVGAAKGNDAKRKAAEAVHAEWQGRANDEWKRRPSLSVAQVARSVAEKYGGKADTIRRAIKKLS